MKTTALLRNLIAEGKTQIVWKTLLVILAVSVGIYKETYFGWFLTILIKKDCSKSKNATLILKKQTLTCLNDIKMTGFISGTL